jgi:transposase
VSFEIGQREACSGFNELGERRPVAMVYVGLDVHRKRTQVAIMDDAGKEIANRNVTNDPGEPMPLLAGLEPGTPVAFESAYGWGWVAELLDGLDLEPHLAHAKNCKAIASARLKNDKVDARTLAHLLRTDLLAEAHIAPKQVRDLRRILRHRATLVRFSTRLKNRIHAVLADDGVALPGSLWTTPGRDWLSDLELPEAKRAVVDDCTRLIDDLGANTGRLEKEIRAAAKQDQRVAALKTIPGIGDITAMTVVAEVDDVLRSRVHASCARGRDSPPRCATPTTRCATATSQSKARCGCAG